MKKLDLNIKGINETIHYKAMASDKSFPYSGLWLFTGSQGSGKTCTLMHYVKQILSEYPEAIVVSNISLFGIPCYPFVSMDDFDKYYNGEKGIIYIIDEIQTLFSSLQSKSMPESTLTVWSQNRKNRRVILGTSQRFNRVAKGIREQTTWNVECKSLIGGLIHCYRFIDGSDYDDNGKLVESDRTEKRFSFYFPKANVMSMYNSLEVVKRDKYDV